MTKALHIIKSPSFESDGRLQKWIQSLHNFKIESDVFFLEDKNEKGFRTSERVKITTTSLFWRKIFQKRQGYLLKIPEYSLKTFRYLKHNDSEILIFHDVQQYFNLLIILIFSLYKDKIVVWDLHELPHAVLLKNFFTKRVLKYIIEHVDIVVYTNNERRQYIYENLNTKEKKYLILNNYPNIDYISQSKTNYPDKLESLRKGLSYIIWLGGGWETRNFTTFLESYKSISKDYNLVILGKIDHIYQDEIDEYVNKKMVYNNFVRQDEMINYIDNAAFSVVLYKSNTPNNYFCEPNRLYQLITRGIPTVVGNNPTMKEIIEKYNGGIVLADDGSDINEMDNAFSKMIDSSTQKSIKTSLKNPSIKIELNWDLQFKCIAETLKTFK